MNNVVKNNCENINFQDMKFCQISNTTLNNYIQNYPTDLDSISDSSLEYDSDNSSNSLNTFSPVSFKSSSSSNSSNSTNSTNSSTSSDSLSFVDEENNYWLRPYSAKYRNRLKQQQQQQQEQPFKYIPINLKEYIKNYTSEHTSELNKDCPLIDNLINKRINSCVVGPSSHIAAFLASTVEIRSCFIPSWKRKGRNR